MQISVKLYVKYQRRFQGSQVFAERDLPTRRTKLEQSQVRFCWSEKVLFN